VDAARDRGEAGGCGHGAPRERAVEAEAEAEIERHRGGCVTDPHLELDLHPADEARPEWSQRPERGGRVWVVLEGDDYEPQRILGVFSTIAGADRMARARMADTPTDYAGRSWRLQRPSGDEVMLWRLGCFSVSIEEHQVVSA